MNSLTEARRDLRLDSSAGSAKPLGLTTKRTIDIILALSGIILLAPLLIICVVLTIATSPGPALFRHRRVGLGGRYFDCLKFRTMAMDAPERLRQLLETDPASAAEWDATRKLRHDPRVTAIGEILRRSSLDELPQLFNVLKGEMSIVGPRPVTEEELEKRRSTWTPPKPVAERGYVSMYIKHVEQADKGCDFDFLIGGSGSVVLRDLH